MKNASQYVVNQSIDGSREGPGGHVPPPRPLDGALDALVTWADPGEGLRARAPYTITGLCLCYVCSKSKCSEVHTAKVYYIIYFGRFYDSTVCISLNFGIFPNNYIFICWCLN